MLTKMNLFWTIFWTSESCVTSFSAPDGSQMQRSADCPQTNRNNCHNFPHLQEEQHVPFVYNPNETTVTTFPTYRRNDIVYNPNETTVTTFPTYSRNDVVRFSTTQTKQLSSYNPDETTVTTFSTYRRNDVVRLSTTQTKQLSQLSPPTGGTTCSGCLQHKRSHNFPHLQEERCVSFVTQILKNRCHTFPYLRDQRKQQSVFLIEPDCPSNGFGYHFPHLQEPVSEV